MVNWLNALNAGMKVLCPCVVKSWCYGDEYHGNIYTMAPASQEIVKMSITMQVSKVKQMCWYNTAPIPVSSGSKEGY